MNPITTFLMFEKDGKQAVELYTSIFKDSKINNLMATPDSGQLINASFSLNGHEFIAMDGGPHFKFADGMSLFVSCENQKEVDYYWDRLGAGGEHGQCGWLKDKFGVSWQIIPTALGQLMNTPDAAQSQRVMQAMLKMGKIDVAELEKAASNL